MLYKVGDKVKIKKREELEKCFLVCVGMLPYAGQIATITLVSDHEYYSISNDKGRFRWDDECFIGVDEEYIEDEGRLTEKTVDEKLEHLRQTVDDLLIEFREFKNRVLELERGKNEV